MKIAIDISHVVYGTGVSVYTKELVRNLLRIDKKNTYILYAGVLRRKDDLLKYTNTLTGNFSLRLLPLPPRAADVMWNYLRPFPIEQFIGPVDVLHTSDWTEPPARCAHVTTVHDLSPVLYPEETHPRIRRVFKRKLDLVKAGKGLIITPSQSVKAELIAAGFDTNRIRTVYEAPNPELFESEDISVFSQLHIAQPYALSVGTAKRKNIERTIEAFTQSQSKTNLKKLVIVGERQHHLPENENVIYTGFVSTAKLAALYKKAEVFIYVSLYEGFGLPILESFKLRCPVVTSNLGSMQEIADESAILVNPFDTADIARGIIKSLSVREQLVKKGAKRSLDFSWEAAAIETLKIYKQSYEEQ